MRAAVLVQDGYRLATQDKPDLARAIELFSMARELNPDIKFYNLPEASLDDPQRYARSLVVGKLLEQGRGLAQQGDVAGATAKFKEALALDPGLGIEPEAEAKRVYAPKMIEQGRALAEQGDIAGATAKFEEALALDPSLDIKPEVEAKRIYAPKVVEEGHSLMKQGDIVGAVAEVRGGVGARSRPGQ